MLCLGGLVAWWVWRSTCSQEVADSSWVRRCGIAVAMHYRPHWSSTYRLTANERKMNTLPTRQWSMSSFTLTCPFTCGDLDTHPIHGSLGPPESMFRMASQLVQPLCRASGHNRLTEHTTPSVAIAVSYTHLTLPTIYSV